MMNIDDLKARINQNFPRKSKSRSKSQPLNYDYEFWKQEKIRKGEWKSREEWESQNIRSNVFFCNWLLSTYLRERGEGGILTASLFVLHWNIPFWEFEGDYKELMGIGPQTEMLIHEFEHENPHIIGNTKVINVKDNRRKHLAQLRKIQYQFEDKYNLQLQPIDQQSQKFYRDYYKNLHDSNRSI